MQSPSLIDVITVITALGSPAIVWWVLKRMTTGFVEQQIDHCRACRADIERRFLRFEARDREIEERQFHLRQTDLPSIRENFAKKSDLDNMAASIRADIRELGREMKEELRVIRDINNKRFVVAEDYDGR